MGASTFVEEVRQERGTTLETAFEDRAERSRREDGRSYSGEIGMKHEVRLVPCAVETFEAARREASRLLAEGGRYADRDGPCWAIAVPARGARLAGWVFFGMARS